LGKIPGAMNPLKMTWLQTVLFYSCPRRPSLKSLQSFSTLRVLLNIQSANSKNSKPKMETYDAWFHSVFVSVPAFFESHFSVITSERIFQRTPRKWFFWRGERKGRKRALIWEIRSRIVRRIRKQAKWENEKLN
jgi:hypothetical protein